MLLLDQNQGDQDRFTIYVVSYESVWFNYKMCWPEQGSLDSKAERANASANMLFALNLKGLETSSCYHKVT